MGVSDDLRARIAEANSKTRSQIEAALLNATASDAASHFDAPLSRHGDGHNYDGTCALCRGDVGALLDAIMPIVEEKLWRANWTSHGKCTFCQALVLEDWARSRRRQVEAHRMKCQFYIGPVEHHRTASHVNTMWWTTIIDCSCGRTYGDGEECPNAAETWRGPAPRGGEGNA